MATGGTLIKEVQGMIDPTRSLERIWRASTGAVARWRGNGVPIRTAS